ncbi:hypothetical protein [Enhygromyxa salina]|uniref:NmrA family NAD(P)-binding protein n=1 Tax=Enhygromyxa salina TaxID=215803 RepID=UPI0011BA6DC4|nr:hypothetical protein [Enhygromyxa salina]
MLIPRVEKQEELETFFAHKQMDRGLIEFAIGDLGVAQSLPAAVDGVDAIALIYPALDFEVSQLEGLAAAVASTCADQPLRHIVHLSAIGADVDAPTRLGRLMGRAEHCVAGIGMPFTHVRPHMFLLMQNVRSFAAEIQRDRVLRLPLGHARTSWIDARDIARVIAALIVKPGNNDGVTLTGPEALTGQDIADMIGLAAGYSVTFEDLPPEKAHGRLLSNGMQSWLVADSLTMFEAFRAGVAAGVSPMVEQLTGSRGTRFNDFAFEYAWAFRQGEDAGQLSGWLN